MAKNLILWLVIAVVLMSVFQSFNPGTSNDQKLDYTRFIQDVRQGQIRDAEIDRYWCDHRVQKEMVSSYTYCNSWWL